MKLVSRSIRWLSVLNNNDLWCWRQRCPSSSDGWCRWTLLLLSHNKIQRDCRCNWTTDCNDDYSNNNRNNDTRWNSCTWRLETEARNTRVLKSITFISAEQNGWTMNSSFDSCFQNKTVGLNGLTQVTRLFAGLPKDGTENWSFGKLRVWFNVKDDFDSNQLLIKHSFSRIGSTSVNSTVKKVLIFRVSNSLCLLSLHFFKHWITSKCEKNINFHNNLFLDKYSKLKFESHLNDNFRRFYNNHLSMYNWRNSRLTIQLFWRSWQHSFGNLLDLFCTFSFIKAECTDPETTEKCENKYNDDDDNSISRNDICCSCWFFCFFLDFRCWWFHLETFSLEWTTVHYYRIIIQRKQTLVKWKLPFSLAYLWEVSVI